MYSRVFVFFRNPPSSADAEGVLLRGHSTGGTKCAFTCDGKYLAVAGAAEGSVILFDLQA